MKRFLFWIIRKLRRTRDFECFYCGHQRKLPKSITAYRCFCGSEYRYVKFGKINKDGTQSIEKFL